VSDFSLVDVSVESSLVHEKQQPVKTRHTYPQGLFSCWKKTLKLMWRQLQKALHNREIVTCGQEEWTFVLPFAFPFIFLYKSYQLITKSRLAHTHTRTIHISDKQSLTFVSTH